MSHTEAPGAKPPPVPRDLSGALRRVRWSRRPALWTSVSGSTRREQLSRAFARLPKRFRVVRIPYGAIPAAEICATVLAELGRSLAGDPRALLLDALAGRSSRRERLLLAIEEADRMPLVEAMRLGELARRSRGVLRVLVVTSGGPESERLRAALAQAGAAPDRPASRGGPSPGSAIERLRPRGRSGARPLPPPPRAAAPPSPRPRPSPVPHRPAEDALAKLEQGLRQGIRALTLQGPPGLGKTFLLHRLGERMADAFEPVWVPCMALAGAELVRWILYCWTGRDPGANAVGAWRRMLARARAGPRGVLILLDDAGALTPDAAAALAAALGAAQGRLRIAMTLSDTTPLPTCSALPDLRTVRLETPLTPTAAAALLRIRFGRDLDEATVGRIVEAACGIPAALLRGANACLARPEAIRAAPLPAPS